MGFRVVTDTSGASDDYYDGSRFFINDGFLLVAKADGMRITYSNIAWLKIEDDGQTIVRQDPDLIRRDPLGGP